MSEVSSRLRRALLGRQNGPVSQLMGGRSGPYTSNYGVSVGHIVEVVEEVGVTPADAEALWATGCRELMIAALLSQRGTLADAWLLRVAPTLRSQELVEQASFRLWDCLGDADVTCAALSSLSGEYSLALSAALSARRVMHGAPLSSETVLSVLRTCSAAVAWSTALSWSAGLLLRQCAARGVCAAEARRVALELEARPDVWARRAAMEWRLETGE